jgi:hypothetical protein
MASVLVADLQNGPLKTTCNAKKMASQCNVNSDTTAEISKTNKNIALICTLTL